MRVDLEVFSTAGHLEGRLIPTDGREPLSFSGVLELLAVIEDLDPEPVATPPGPISDARQRRSPLGAW